MILQKLNGCVSVLHLTWSAPAQIVLAVVYLWQLLGISALAGVALMVLVVPLNLDVTRRAKAVRKARSKYQDQRVKEVNEVRFEQYRSSLTVIGAQRNQGH